MEWRRRLHCLIDYFVRPCDIRWDAEDGVHEGENEGDNDYGLHNYKRLPTMRTHDVTEIRN